MGCTNHPVVESGLQACWICGKSFCPDCVVEFQSRTLCGPCKATAVARLESGASDAVGGEGEAAPWERRAELGTVAAFVATCKAAMLEPQRFFSKLDRTRQGYDFLVFPMIIQVLVALSQAAVQFAMFGSLWMYQATPGDGLAAAFAGGFGLIGVVLAPIFAVIGAFIGAGFIHVALLVMKKATVPYQQTLRGYCYASAPNVLAVVPFLGMAVGPLWALVTQVLMVKERHRCSGGTAAIAVLWIVGLALCCGGVAAIAMVGVAMSNR